MKRFPVFAKTIRDYRSPALWMAFVGALIGMLDILIYPSYRDSLKDFEKNLPEVMKAMTGAAGSITTPAGFLNAEWFSWIPLLFITVAVIAATGVTAGEEAAGTLDLLLAQPRSRRRVLLEKAAGIAVSISAATMLSAIGFLVAKPFVEFGLTPLELVAATFYTLPLILLYGAIALWAGVTLPTRSSASMVVIGLVVAAYFVQLIGGAVSSLNDIQKVSPFYWADASHVLIDGFDWGRFLGILAVDAVILGLAVFSFERRDISAGRREWSIRNWLRRGRPNGAEAEHEGHERGMAAGA